jgi:hypothetical protein
MGNPRQDLFSAGHQPDDHGALYGLATLCDLTYSRIEALADLWGAWAGYDATQIAITPGSLTPNYLYAVDPGGCVFAITGTENWQQILGYTLFSFIGLWPDFAMKGVHTGFYWLFTRLVPLIDAHLATVPDGTKVLFTGHSLGGAIANLLAIWYRNQGRYDVRGAVTFAAPKCADPGLRQYARTTIKANFRNEGDIIPGLPPASPLKGSFSSKIGALFFLYRYCDLNAACFLDPDGGWRFREERLGDDYGHLVHALLSPLAGADGVSQIEPYLLLHSSTTYRTRLRNRVQKKGRPIDIEPLNALNALMDGNSYFTSTVNRYMQPQGGAHVYALSDPTQPPSGSPATLPPDPQSPQTIRRVLVRSVSIGSTETVNRHQERVRDYYRDPTAPAGSPTPPQLLARPRWHFRGGDRRLLQLLAQLCQAIEDRDELVDMGVESAARSNDLAIVDRFDPDQSEAFYRVWERLETLLRLVRD